MSPLLADLVLILHLAWIAFIILGLALAWRWPSLAWPHLLTLVFILVLNLGGWYCPLTHLEAWLRGPAGPEASFLAAGLERLVYPGLPEAWLRLAGGLWAAANLAGHVRLLRARRSVRASR